MESNKKEYIYEVDGKKVKLTKQEYIKVVATQIIKNNLQAFKELAK